MRGPQIADHADDDAEPEATVDRLVVRAQEGDREAFDALVERYREPVLQLALKLVGDPDTAEDLALEAFARAYLDLPGFSGRSTFFTWLYRITMNVCFRHLRRTRRRAEDHRSPHDMEMLPSATMDDHTSREVLRRLQREALVRGLGELPEQQRAALFLFHFLDYTYLEVSRALGLPVNTVKSHVRRGMLRLRKVLRRANLTEAGPDGDSGQALD